MKRLLLSLSIVIGAWVLSPTPEARAWSWGWSSSEDSSRHYRHHYGTHAGVPELDPSAAGSAMVLLLGGIAYIASRRREEDVVA